MLLLLYIICTVMIVGSIGCGFLMFTRTSLPMEIKNNKKSYTLVSVIIPVRNEANRIRPLMKSLQKQHGQPFEVIVVDDDSTDNTIEVVKEYGYTVRTNKQLKEGWIGKSAACWNGANAAKGKLLLFLDADVRLHKDTLKKLVEAYDAEGSNGILSLQPYHTVQRPYENLSIIFNLLVMVGMNVFTVCGNKLKSAGSFGPCMMCNREEYFAVGGHAAIKDAVMDDLELGKAFQTSGYPVRCYGGKGLIDFRMYSEGFRQLWEGWSKSFGTASKSTHPLVTVLISGWFSGGISTLLLLLLAIINGSTNWMIIAIVGYLVFMLQLLWFSRRIGNFSVWASILFPLPILFFIILFSWSLFRVAYLGSVSWRGRKIKV